MKIVDPFARRARFIVLSAFALSISLSGCGGDSAPTAEPQVLPAPDAGTTQAGTGQAGAGQAPTMSEQMHDQMAAEDMHREMSAHEHPGAPDSAAMQNDRMASSGNGQAASPSAAQSRRMAPKDATGTMPADAPSAGGAGGDQPPASPPMPMQDDPPMGAMPHM